MNLDNPRRDFLRASLAASLAIVADESCLGELKERLAGTGIGTAGGARALIEAASRPVDTLMAAIVAQAGLPAKF